MRRFPAIVLLVLFAASCVPPDTPQPVLPEYHVHSRNPHLQGGESGHVIIPNGDGLLPDSLAQVALIIAEKEDLRLCFFYTTVMGYQANVSASYSAENPEVLERDYLGTVQDGEFAPP